MRRWRWLVLLVVCTFVVGVAQGVMRDPGDEAASRRRRQYADGWPGRARQAAGPRVVTSCGGNISPIDRYCNGAGGVGR